MNPENRPTEKWLDRQIAARCDSPRRTTAPHQTVLGTRTMDVHIAIDTIDLKVLQGHFKQLADQATDLLQRSGYDFDDVIFDRFLSCRARCGASFRVEAMWLADRRRLVDSITDAMPAGPVDDSRVADVVITHLGIDVLRDVME